MDFLETMCIIFVNNLETMASMMLSKLNILPEILFGLYKCGIMSLHDVDLLESYLVTQDDPEASLFAREVCKWIIDFIGDKENSYQDRMYTTRVFVQYLYIAYMTKDLRSIYNERHVDIDYILN